MLSPALGEKAALGFAVALLLGTSLALGAVEPSEAATTGDCNVQAANPTKEAGRTRVAFPTAVISCTTRHRVEIELQLWGDDPVYDDRMSWSVLVYGPNTPLCAGDRVGDKFDCVKRTVTAEPGRRVEVVGSGGGYGIPCDEDIEGRDEVYSRIRARIADQGSATAWTRWTSGPNLNTYC